jgi:hypothetical protein
MHWKIGGIRPRDIAMEVSDLQLDNGIPAGSYLITFRDGDGARRSLLQAVLAWLSNLEWLEVIVVEQDARQRLDPAAMPLNVDYVFAYNDGPFNKSWGLNVAARRANHELLITGDADMIMSSEALTRALAVCAGPFDAVSPYANLVDLDEPETRSFLDGGLKLDALLRSHVRDRRHQGEHLCFCGGICVFRRKVYFALGGMDERFLGWGGEDDAMSINLQRYTGRLAVQKDTVAFHLWHPRPSGRYTHEHYRNNLALANGYRTCDSAALENWRSDQRASMGDSDRFRRES